MELNNKRRGFLSVMILAIIAYLPVFIINKPLWDDYTLTGSSFEELTTLFRNAGGYYIGVGHLHHLLNVINGDSVFFSRLISFVLMISLAASFYIILDKLDQSAIQKKILCFLFILLPLFGACFTQITIPSIICFNLFLLSVIYLINYIKHKNAKDLILYILFVLISYITNSLLFFVAPVLLLVWVLHEKRLTINKKLVTIILATIASVVVFMILKHFFMHVNTKSTYVNYNKITMKGLLFDGPVNTLIQIPDFIIILFSFVFDILKAKANFLLVIIAAFLFYLAIKRTKWEPISLRYFLIASITSVVLIFSAVYPYAVVGKINKNLYEYTSRFDMLMVIGLSILIMAFVLFIFKNQLVGKIVLSALFSLFFVGKLCIFINFYYHANLQTAFYDSYLSKLDPATSYLIHEKKEFSVNWRFYEVGGILRSHNATENVLYITGKSKLYANDTLNAKAIHEMISINHFALRNFSMDNFQYKPIEFVFKESIDVWDFTRLFFDPKRLNFTVKELPS